MITMSFVEWEKEYKPVISTRHGIFIDYLFDTDSETIKFLVKQNPLCVWTLIHLDRNGEEIVNAITCVNRLGYYLTEKPYKEDEYIVVITKEPMTEEEYENENG